MFESADRSTSPTRLGWSLIGNIIYAFSQLGILVLFTRLRGDAEVGKFALGIAISAPVVMFLNMRLRLVISADTSHSRKFQEYLRSRIISAVFVVVIVYTITVGARIHGTSKLVVLAVALAKAIESISDIIYGLILREGRADLLGKSLALRGLGGLGVVGIIVLAGGNVLHATVGLVAAWSSVLVLKDWPTATTLDSKWKAYVEIGYLPSSLRDMTSLWRSMFPLAIVAYLGSLTTNVSRYVVQHEMGDSALGQYAILAYFAAASMIVAAAIGQPFLRKLGVAANAQNSDAFQEVMKRLYVIALVLGSTCVAGAMIAGRLVLGAVYGSVYEYLDSVLVLVMVGGLLSNLALYHWYALIAMEKYTIQIAIGIVSIAVILVSSLMLIPHYGLIGAASADIIGIAVNLVGSIWAYQVSVKAMRRSSRSQSHS